MSVRRGYAYHSNVYFASSIIPPAARHNLAQPGTTWHNLAQPGTTWHNLAQPGTTWHNLAQPGTTWHNPETRLGRRNEETHRGEGDHGFPRFLEIRELCSIFLTRQLQTCTRRGLSKVSTAKRDRCCICQNVMQGRTRATIEVSRFA